MNGYIEVRLRADEKKNLIIQLIGDGQNDDATITIPIYLRDDFRDQIERVWGF